MDERQDILYYIMSWVFIIPIALSISLFVMIFVSAFLILILSLADCFSFKIIGFVLSLITPMVWLSTTYVFAPSHNNIANWLSLVVGFIVATVFSYYFFADNYIVATEEIKYFLITTLFIGILFSLFLHKELKTKCVSETLPVESYRYKTYKSLKYFF